MIFDFSNQQRLPQAGATYRAKGPTYSEGAQRRSDLQRLPQAGATYSEGAQRRSDLQRLPQAEAT